MNKPSGFTLMELVIVIIVLSILGALAIPKFINLYKDTRATSTREVATALSSANKLNHETRKKDHKKGVPITNCTSISKTLPNGLPSDYTIMSADVAVDATATCTVKGLSETTATFTVTGIL